MDNILDTPITYLKGVGPARAGLLEKELGIATFGDLLFHFPFRYVDRSKFYKISEAVADQTFMQFAGRLRNISESGQPRKRRLTATLYDDSGAIDLVWFKGLKWIKPTLREGAEYVVFGKPTRFQSRLNIVHPEIEPLSNARLVKGRPLQPVYSTTEKLSSRGLNSRGIERLQIALATQLKGKIDEVLPQGLMNRLKLMPRAQALYHIHFPAEQRQLELARFRMKFEELFFMQLLILHFKGQRKKKNRGYLFEKVGHYFNRFYKEVLPFELTEAQKRVMREIRKDMKTGRQMNRLLQGDVGSGKTIVAVMAMLLAVDNGYQAALMAPTEILAFQHYEGIAELLKPLGLNVGLLTGSTKASDRRQLHSDLESGDLHILIGTHALLEDKVRFHHPGLVIIDEQHRFGVAQRSKMWAKASIPPHILVMSATPIPRTLAMTVYGDLDVSVIDELPPGRKPVKTLHYYDAARLKVFGFMKKQIALGRQVYVVYPLIKESEKMDYKDLLDGFESISREFPLPDYRVSIVHGQMKPAEKEYEMQRFVKGETQIMVATTVIEVGVNVPNASVMIIESAERFGLSQLHQLRGRVGRGADQSYCILMTSFKLTNEAKARIEAMVRTTDGFEIAETDLRLRGPGDLMGTQQSGLINFKIADLSKDGKILRVARDAASLLLSEDPGLNNPAHKKTRVFFRDYAKQHPDWGMIS